MDAPATVKEIVVGFLDSKCIVMGGHSSGVWVPTPRMGDGTCYLALKKGDTGLCMLLTGKTRGHSPLVSCSGLLEELKQLRSEAQTVQDTACMHEQARRAWARH